MKDKNYQFTWFDWFCLWYPPGWLILFNRHWQHYHADPDGWNWCEYGLFLLPGGFYLALLIRWLRLGCRLPRKADEEFNPNYQQLFREEVLNPIVKYYFRAELKQIENLPETGPLIVAMNHAGMCFPWDFLGLAYLLGNARGWTVQPLAGMSLFEHPWVIWWLPSGWAQVLGGVRAELAAFEAAVAHKTILLYAPEGIRGPGKGWSDKFELQTFHPSFINLSDRYQIPVLPVVCLGNESLHPLAFNWKKLGSFFGLPFLPISFLIIVFILFPSMGVWAMRSRLRYYIQPLDTSLKPEIISAHHEKEEANVTNYNRLNNYQRAQLLREKMQITLDSLR